MTEYLVDPLSTRLTKPKRPLPSREWMVGYTQGNAYVTDGSILMEVAELAALRFLPKEIQKAFESCHNTDEPSEEKPQGVRMTLLKGARETMFHYPRAKQLMPLSTHPIEHTMVTIVGKMGTLRLLRNPVDNNPITLNDDFIGNLLWLGGFPHHKKHDDVFRCFQADPISPDASQQTRDNAPVIIEPLNGCGIRFLIMPVQVGFLHEIKTLFAPRMEGE